jgi:hypothetical protein
MIRRQPLASNLFALAAQRLRALQLPLPGGVHQSSR